MPRIEWSRIDDDDMEHVISMLLCRENKRANRIRPSQGDGGIDVIVPTDDGAYEIYQVKSFSANLTASQKGQAERSFNRLLEFAQARGMRIDAWHLTMPLEPTNENLDWLKGFTEGHEFESTWKGLAFIEGLVSEYPSVIDYYLHDGRARLETAIESLTSVLRLQMSADQSTEHQPLHPAEAVGGLAALHATLNQFDPHYFYDFSVDTVRPPLVSQPDLIAAVQRGIDGRHVTIRVFTRCEESLAERPIPVNVRINAEGNSELADQLQAFEQFGTPLHTPAGTADVQVDLPGGLGGAFTSGSVRITGVSDDQNPSYSRRLQIIDQNFNVLTEVIVDMNPPSSGLTGEGVRAWGRERQGAFTIEILTHLVDQTSKINIAPTDITGLAPSDLLPGLRVLNELRAPNGIRFAELFGPINHTPIWIPDGSMHDQEYGTVLQLVTALATVQQHTTVQLSVPNLFEFTIARGRPILDAADLLNGKIEQGTWTGGEMHLHPGTVINGDPMTILLHEKHELEIEGQSIPLGMKRIQLLSAQFDLESIRRHDDHDDVRVLPFGEPVARTWHVAGSTNDLEDQT